MAQSQGKILVVEDDPKLGPQMVQALTDAGFDCDLLTDGDAASRVRPDAYRLILLDLMLPGTYGMDLLKRYRERADVPILIVSARQEATDKVRSFGLGADDYITKPFWPAELLARVQANLRRPVLQRAQTVRFGELELDLESHQVHVAGVAVELTPTEFDILALLCRRPGSSISRRALAEHVFGSERQGTERTLDVHVSRLRKKLGTYGARVATVWGVGYRFDAEGSPEGS